MTSRFRFISFILVALLFASCSNDSNYLEEYNNKSKVKISQERYRNKDKCMDRFSEILSKAVYEKKEVRDFLKTQALKKIDNSYNIFYTIVKDEKVDQDHSFKDILVEYAINREELEEIEKYVPLLNIHVPELNNQKVRDINTTDNEIPVLFSKNLYFKGEVVDSLSSDEVPGFNLFVVCESSSIRKKESNTKSLSVTFSLDNDYEYVDNCFNPSTKNSAKTRSVDYDDLSDKYNEKGYIPSKDIDPSLLEAYANSKNNPRATRCLMYYGLKSLEETPSNIQPKANVKDCIFRFRIAAAAFLRLEDVATSSKEYPFFNKDVTNLKATLSRGEVLSRILTGRAFCFLFRIEGNINGNNVVSEGMKVYVTPDQLFNLKIDETKRHKTMFRHTKYTYVINKSGIKSKWFYPLDHKHDTRLNKWDIFKDPINKRIIVYALNPNEGKTTTITEKYSLTYVSHQEVGGSISLAYKAITLGLNGKLDNTNTISKDVTSQYTVSEKNELIDEFYFDFFDDYPIGSDISNDNYIIPNKIGKGIIEMSILPISDDFYIHKIFNTNN